MAITLYDITVPVLLRGLGTALGGAGEGRGAHADAEEIPAEELVERAAGARHADAGRAGAAGERHREVRGGADRRGGELTLRRRGEELRRAAGPASRGRGPSSRRCRGRRSTGRRRRRSSANIGRQPVTIGAVGLCAAVRAAELLLPRHHRLRHPAARAAWRSARWTISARCGLRAGRCAAKPVFLFDLDGTLVDSVYQHVLAWKEALDAEGIELSVWRIHRKIGMSGGLFTNQLLRETGLDISDGAGRAAAARRMPRPTSGIATRSGRCRARGSCWPG